MAKGKAVGTGRSSPEMASDQGGSRGAEPKGEIADRALAAHKPHIDKTFGYFAVHDTSVGFRPT